MNKYYVTWNCTFDADSPEDAARQAWEMVREENSIASVFVVHNLETFGEVIVDVLEGV